MNRDEVLAIQAKAMTERDFQTKVMRLAKALHWVYAHSWTSIHSAAGFPDLVLVSRQQARVLFRELKREGKHPTPIQRAWLDDLTHAGMDAGVWRPIDLLTGRVEAELRRPTPSEQKAS